MGIPSNIYFYDNLIKENFTISDSSDSEEDLTEKQYLRGNKKYELALERFKARNINKKKDPR